MHAQAQPSMRDCAIALAHKGFRVFRLVPNSKLPAVKRFYDVASSDPVEVKSMWTDGHGKSLDNNIGVLTGNGLLVIDVDVKPGKRGNESMVLFEDMGLDLDTLTVKTPSGGRHLYYDVKGHPEFAGRTNKLGNGLDTRAYHNYVVGPGSIIDGKAYEQTNGAEIKPAPRWLVGEASKGAFANAGRKRASSTPLVEEDSETAISQATWWLANNAPEAREGEGGNHTTFRVACKMRDLGLSEAGALEILLDQWNDVKALPPWNADELEAIVGNAYRYAHGALGSESADAQFEAVEIETKTKSVGKTANVPRASLSSLMHPFTWEEIPPRRWVMPGWLAREFVSGVISPGAMGKTQLMIALMLAIASGSSIPFGIPPTEKTAVWYWNQEDNMTELRRRVAAAMQHFGITHEDLGLRVRLNSGVEEPLVLVEKKLSGLRMTDKVEAIIQDVRDNQIGVFMFDPLVEFHEADENDNVEMRAVVGAARRIAVEGGCAVLAVAHSRKPPAASSESYAGDVDTMRGAGAQANVIRIAHTLYGMSEKDAQAWGVSAEERHLYVRSDLAKANLTVPDPRPRWWRRVSVPLGHLGGEQVGVLEPAALVAVTEKEPDMFEAVAFTIAGTLERGKQYGFERLSHEGCRLGVKKNFARAVVRSIRTVPGVIKHKMGKTSELEQWSVETRQGKLDIWVRPSRPGITFALEEVGGGAEEARKETPVSVG